MIPSPKKNDRRDFPIHCASLYAFSSMREWLSRFAKSASWIALVALILRMAYFLYMAHLIPPPVLAAVPFQNEVGNVASSLAEGQGFCCLFRQVTGPTAWLSPVYPLLVACIFKVFGIFTLRSLYTTVSLNCVFSALATIPLFYAAKRIAGDTTAAVAGWIWTIFPAGIVLPFQWIWDTSLSVLLSAALLWGTIKLEDSRRRRDFALYGLLWGISVLTNPTLGAVLPLLLGWLLYQHRVNRALQLRLGLVTLGVLCLTCLPWTIRNYEQFHHFIPLRSNFPYEFWSGNNEIFDEHSREVNRITRYEQVHLYAELGENEFLHEKMAKALDFVRTHPALYARLFGERIMATWFGTDSPWQDFLQTESNLARFVLGWNAIALVGILAGLVRLYIRRRAYFLPVASFPLFFPLTFYIAHTTLRHRHPCDPILALLIAVGIAGAQARDPQK
jgi:4-amino-4-deoxy-L-arabinose transferase-like glycosyltransferase